VQEEKNLSQIEPKRQGVFLYPKGSRGKIPTPKEKYCPVGMRRPSC